MFVNRFRAYTKYIYSILFIRYTVTFYWVNLRYKPTALAICST